MVVAVINGLHRVSLIGENIHHLVFDTARNLNKALIRFQEHYESPQFKGKCFSLQEYRHWYMERQNSKCFTYYDDWAGNNFPSHILEPFYGGQFGRLSPAEQRLLDYFAPIRNKPFYIIGTSLDCDDTTTFDHELAHALYHLHEDYRIKVHEHLIDFPCQELINTKFAHGYDVSVAEDEVNAYFATGDAHMLLYEEHVCANGNLIDQLEKLYYNERRTVI